MGSVEGQKGLWEMGSQFKARDWCRGKFASLHRGATSPSKYLFQFYYNSHTYAAFVVDVVNMFRANHIFLFWRLKKPCDGGMKHAFILGPISLVVNNRHLKFLCAPKPFIFTVLFPKC